MKNTKYGISLMVLILTVIIMVILAGTVIISLNNAGIINRSNTAVNDYNLKQVEELANLGWGEAYLAGNTTQTSLETYVMNYLTKNGVDTSKYYIDVTTKGVMVKDYLDYEQNGWEVAWAYTNGVWSSEIYKGENLNGDVIAKLYKTSENDKYDLIISGTGEMGPGFVGMEDPDNDLYWIEEPQAYIKAYSQKLRNVTIQEGITNISKSAFIKTSIETIKIADTVRSIEYAAFYRV